jgi:hypothetical protein
MNEEETRLQVAAAFPELVGKGTCAVCLRPTDTGLAFRGEAEWVIAGLMGLRVPQEQAEAMLSGFTGCGPGMVPVGEVTVPVRVCRRCVESAAAEWGGRTLPVGVLPTVPVILPRESPVT